LTSCILYYFLMHKDMYFCYDKIKNIKKRYGSMFLKVVIRDLDNKISVHKDFFNYFP
jgi:hypothetical protein